ncbi:hypothetical protein ST47_g4154 [Ascochyta rabiei]|uniref:SAM-dependent MTase RsmB/NOP-type domain-containing protein n=1 Tax=Didymella rabiei TaxID=5454 RepID=A0A163G5Q2_DIDRA|nr:hypothetical protein ST47_g4154 [Ascochyta rabiei]
MSLYYEAATILENADKIGGSFKARIFKKKELKSKPGQIYALVAEASKWSKVLKDVIEKCAVLKEERKLTPILALLLTHDLLLSKAGVAAHRDHVLRLAITRHKARLTAEMTKARIRHGFPTLDAFRLAVNNGELEDADEEDAEKTRHPRWVRVNTIKSSLRAQLDSTFKAFSPVESIGHILAARGGNKLYFKDPNIPDLLALPSRVDLSKTPAYAKGEIIFQDKASCFPAHLLDLREEDGDVIDGCAAPGNKTTHAAAIVSAHGKEQRVIAFERDKGRTAILQKMVKLAGADGVVTVKGSSDFIAAKPNSPEFERVGAILLDPSCSGTGIVGRDDAIKLHLPSATATAAEPSKNKKRKRGAEAEARAKPPAEPAQDLTLSLDDTAAEEVPLDAADKLAERLAALSTFQLHILTHAMRFPHARKITYSTCSIHFEENEGVVFQALATSVAKERGWRILARDKQVPGLRAWARRGQWEDGRLSGSLVDAASKQDVLAGCIRCDKATEEGTMGFFVAAFVREGDDPTAVDGGVAATDDGDGDDDDDDDDDNNNNNNDDDEWHGFSDDEKAAQLKAVADKVVDGPKHAQSKESPSKSARGVNKDAKNPQPTPAPKAKKRRTGR